MDNKLRKVLNIYSTLYLPAVGGVEMYSHHLAHEAAAAGYEVNVVTTATTREVDETGQDGVRVCRLSSIRFMGGRLLIPYRPLEWLKVYRNCYPKNSFVLSIGQTRFFPLTLLATVLTRIAGRRIAIIDHGSGHLRYGNRYLTVMLACYEHVTTAFLKSFNPRFFGVSRAASEWLKHFGINADGVIPNAVSERPAIAAAGSGKRKDARPYIFFGSRLIPEKGIFELIEAFHRFRSLGYDYKLVLAGSGPLAADLRKLSAKDESVEFLGSLPPESLRKTLANCSIFVNPSNYPEGLPTILLEAGIEATPVISTRQGGSAEVIRHRETGLLIECGRSDLIADALVEMANDPKTATGYGANLQRLVRRQYLWRRVAERFFTCAEAMSWTA